MHGRGQFASRDLAKRRGKQKEASWELSSHQESTLSLNVCVHVLLLLRLLDELQEQKPLGILQYSH